MTIRENSFRPESIGFDAVFQCLPDPVFIYNHTLRRIEKLNPAAEKVYGYSAEEFQGMGPWDVEYPYAKEGLLALIDGLRIQGSAVYCTEHRNRSGRRFPVEVHAIYHSIGGQDYFVAICRGIEERLEIEDRARRSETRYRAIIENAQNLVCVLEGEAGRIVDANPALRRLVGVEGVELEGLSLSSFVPAGALRVALAEALSRARDAGGSKLSSLMLETADGDCRYTDWQYQAFDDGTLFGVGRDVTEERAALGALAESERQLRLLLELSPVAMVVVDQARTHLQLNRAFTRLFGYTSEELPDADSWWEKVYPDDEYREGIQKRWFAMLSEAQEKGNWFVGPIEVEVTCKDGTNRIVECSLGFAGDNDLVVFTDLTASKRYEAEIRRQNQHLDLHFRNTPLGVLEWDIDFRVRSWNPAAERIFGYSREEAIGMTGLELLPNVGHDEIMQVWESLKRQSGGSVNTNQNRCKDGSVVTCTWYNTPLAGADGEIEGVASLVMDVSDRLRYEEELRCAKEAAERASRAKTEFLSVMSHELRTPLNSIIGPCQLLRAQLGADLGEGLLEVMLSSSEHLLNLINSILDLAKIESGGMEPNVEVFDLGEFLETRLRPLKEVALKKGLEFRITNGLPEGTLLESDPLLLLQMCFNLIGNATKFTSSGSIEVVATRGERKGRLRLAVVDTGVGIREEDLKSLFEPFVQLERPQFGESKGTGLGLVITKQIAALLGGEISVESWFGVGSRFTFEVEGLKLPRAVTPLVGSGGKDGGRLTVAWSGRPVLVVEDEPNNQFVCGALLKYLGVPYEMATSGEAALARYREERFAVVLMDIKLPGMDGAEASRLLLEEAGADGLYIIAQTAYALREQREQYLEAGIHDYLTKPLSLESLARALEKALRALE